MFKILKGLMMKKGIKDLTSYTPNKWTKRIFTLFIALCLIFIGAGIWACIVGGLVGQLTSGIIIFPSAILLGIFAYLTYLVLILDKPYSKKKEEKTFVKLDKYNYKLLKRLEKKQTREHNKALKKDIVKQYKSNKK